MKNTLNLELAGDNTLTISLRYNRDGRQVIEAVEYGSNDYRHVHYSGGNLINCVDIANVVLAAEEETLGVKHDRFDLETVRDALYPDTENMKRLLKTKDEQLSTLGNAVCEYISEGMLEGSSEVHRVLEKLWLTGLVEPTKVTVRVTGTMVRTFEVDTEIEVMPWHVNSTQHIEGYYEDEIVAATDDDYFASTELSIDSVEEA